MGLLDIFKDPSNQQTITAGLLDIGAGYSGRRGGNQAALQAARIKHKQAMQAQFMEQQEKLRQEALERENRAAFAAAYRGPDIEETTPYPLSPDEMFYDPATEYDSNPAARAEAESLINLQNVVGTRPAPLPSTPAEINAAMQRVLGSGVDPEPYNAMITAMTGYSRPQTVSAGGAMVDPMTGQPMFSQPAAKVQELQYQANNPGLVTRMTSDEKMKAELAMGKDFRPLAVAMDDFRFQNEAIQGAANDGTGHLVMIKGINKLLDPGSVVREAESAETANVAGTLKGMMNYWSRAIEGNQLPQEAYDQIKRTAQRLYALRRNDYLKRVQSVNRMATGYGLDPANVFQGSWTGGDEPDRPAAKSRESLEERARRLGVK